MKIKTDYTGVIEYTRDELIVFPTGIFGFEDHKEYIIVGDMTADFPFVWLQSIKDKNVAFVLTDPFLFVEDYDFSLDEETVGRLEIHGPEDLQIYGICVVPEKIKDTTLNLKSPIIINAQKRIGLQLILDEDWTYKHKLFKKK